MRIRTIILSFTLLTALAQAEDRASQEADWASLDIGLSALETWDTRVYTYSAREPGGEKTAVLGTVTLSTELSDDAVILKDNYQINYRGEELSLELSHTCRKDNYLSPKRIESKGEGSDEVSTFVATVAQGKATVREKDGGQSVRELPEGTITMSAMMRLVTVIPKTPNRTYSYEYSLESEEMNLKEDYRLEVLPSEAITIDDRQVQCSKFKLSGGGIHPAYYWVAENGVLQRLMMEDRKILQLVDAP